MQRRTLLSSIGAGTLSLAGCTTQSDTVGSDDQTDENTDIPEDCPTSQGLDVEWPDDPDSSSVKAFVEDYESVYYRDVVIEYKPESQLDSYELSGRVTDPPREVRNGWELAYSGGGAIYRPTLLLGATTSDPSDGADLVPVSEIEEEPLTEMLEEAAETGEGEFHVDRPGNAVDQYIDRFISLSDDFERLSEPGDSDSLYVDVDGTTVELSVHATNTHGDYGWEARYYVNGRVVRRTTDDDTAAQNGELLECRKLS